MFVAVGTILEFTGDWKKSMEDLSHYRQCSSRGSDWVHPYYKSY